MKPSVTLSTGAAAGSRSPKLRSGMKRPTGSAHELSLADDLRLPLEAVTQTFLILGQRDAGKTNSAVVIAEELFGAGAPVCVLDPVDVWWGLKASAGGEGAGLPIY